MSAEPGSEATAANERPGEGVPMLAQAVLALRSTGDLGTAWGISSSGALHALGAEDARLLRVDRRSGALFRLEESGVELPYLAEHGGPVEWVMRHDRALWDAGEEDSRSPRETLLWQQPPAALVTLPLQVGSTNFGFLLIAFRTPRHLDHGERLLVRSLADALALALERLDLHRALEEERARAGELERRLLHAEESTSSLMSIVAHEVRSPLASIKAYAETLVDNLHNPHAPHRRFLSIIDEECDRLAGIVADVHDLSRIDGGEVPLRIVSVAPQAIAREACDAMGILAAGNKLRFEAGTGDDLQVEADAELIRRLFTNLLANAAQFSPDGGTVRVSLEARGDEWVGSITDQGPPLPSEDLARVFDGFYRARRPGVPAAEGTRMGLAIARGIVVLHGGRLWAEQPGGGGARFCFSMPIRQLATPRSRRIARQTVGRADLHELFDAIVEMIAASLEAEIVSLVMVDPDRGDLFVVAALGLTTHELEGRRTMVRNGVAGAVAAWGRPVLVENIETDRRFKRMNHPQYATKSLLCVPLRVEGEVVGVVNVNNKVNGESFDDDDLALLVMLTERVGSAIERACSYPDSRRVVLEALETVRCMTRLKRDCALGGRRLVRLARATARRLGMSASDVDVIGYVASIHDLGMTRLQGEIMHPGRLNETQRTALLEHPEVSVEILRPLEYLGLVRDLILSHHERWDGTGYPRGLAGDHIPLGARILSVVDAWESMIAGRPYRPPRDVTDAVEELRLEAGRQFDPEVVEAFLAVIERDSGA